MTYINVLQTTQDELKSLLQEVVRNEIRNLQDKKVAEDELITRDKACTLLGVSLTTLYHWNNKKILEASKIGRRVYYRKQQILNLLEPSK